MAESDSSVPEQTYPFLKPKLNVSLTFEEKQVLALLELGHQGVRLDSRVISYERVKMLCALHNLSCAKIVGEDQYEFRKGKFDSSAPVDPNQKVM